MIRVVQQAGSQTKQPAKACITHLEIRRVQNGYVVGAVDLANGFVNQRSSFVATNDEELCNVIKSILTGGDLEWLPTVDMPVMQSRIPPAPIVPSPFSDSWAQLQADPPNRIK